MQLQYISIARLIIEAGGDPWAINAACRPAARRRYPIWRRRFMTRASPPPSPTPPSRRPVAVSRRPGIGRTASTRSTTPPKCSA